MYFFGDFNPVDGRMWNRTLQRLNASIVYCSYFLWVPLGFVLAAYLVMFTRLWWLVLLYLAWMFVDRKTPERVGRRMNWVRESKMWAKFAEYFDHKIETLPGVELDPSRNYLFACFPHGILPVGPCLSFLSTNRFKRTFPHHLPTVATLTMTFYSPFAREYLLALGYCSSSKEALRFFLAKKGGGNAVALVVGGAAEAYHSRPGNYKFFLKERKGFVRVALECGSPLVPAITFGETQVFTQMTSEGSLLRRIQRLLHERVLGFAPIIANGRGLFQDYFGLVPRQVKLTTLVGKPIPVERIENPTKEEVDRLHGRFIRDIVALFEENKHKYLDDFENVNVEII